MKVLRPTTDFPTWGSSKGTENPQGIFPWRPVRLDYRTSMGLVKETLRGHKQNLVYTRNQEDRAVTLTGDGGRLACECPRVPRGGMGQHGYCGVRDTEYNSPGINHLEGGCYYPYHSLASSQLQGGNTAVPINRKLDYRFTKHVRTRLRFPHSQSLQSGSFHKSLILINQSEDRMKIKITEN